MSDARHELQRESDPYVWWRAALANPEQIGKELPVHAGQPEWGFFKRRCQADRPYVPAAVWQADGVWLCKVGYEDLFQMRDAAEEWSWLAHHPVSHAAYLHAHAFHVWPDDDDASVAAFLAKVDGALQSPDPDAGELSHHRDQLDGFRKRAKAPWLEKGRAVDSKFTSLRDRIDDTLKALATKEKEAA